MKITIFNSKTTKMLASFFLAVACLGGINIVNISNVAEAKIITTTPKAERAGAETIFKKEKEKYHLRDTAEDSPLRKIQDNLVAYNSDRLNYNDGKHDRWLSPVGIADSNYPYNGASCGGVTYIKKEYEDALIGCPEYNIVGYSNVAALLAHEFGHFVNKDTLSWVEGIPKAARRDDEFEADQMGMNLLDKVPEYSIASMLNYASGFQNIYPTATDDMKYIEDWSYGRVKLVQLDPWNCIFTVDGKVFSIGESHGLWDSYDARAIERTQYLMGQIASCIHHNMWKKGNMLWGRESDYFLNGRPNKTTLLVYDKNSNVPIKFLGTFDFSIDDLNAPKHTTTIKTMAKDMEIASFNAIKDFPKE